MRRDRRWWQKWLERLQWLLRPEPVPVRATKKYLVLFVGVGLLAAMASAAMAETSDAPDEQVAHLNVRGELTYITTRAISVEFERTKGSSKEMLLPLSEETTFTRVRSLDELKRGDTVKVDYQQRYRKDEHGQRVVLGTTATNVTLVRSAPQQELTSREAPPE